ncbi:MAG: NifB/NifX family molybdenum-iron cluster-binding protein [Candidatus Cloacimonadaceae bacterium]|nr:NifB/NifX family molybdenum-iron cluster-binding protein [Candidatus Cloacimonadota bacterium]MDY0127601.1 NifB/NifX family molybdenum-iron cluster-binding protein [Candidatus Cloacimonadaceae bacterium]MCB5254871.1 NifB/NifX family molybdenum-iron cluster-binding protein [Candidatus Cloacimonadota bacterium]MCK9178783.1 NifB/NifX family molybdenum-iron cluster-binding protein [Candidatus Cloacimonadota bacterium]MCK9243611.1 NifB/NifX family molybdenum-iron cluster-binding protein [Candidat
MRIIFTSTGEGWDAKIDPRFGRTDYIVLYDEEKDELTALDNRAIMQVAHGAGPKTAQKIHELKADVLITGNGPGGNAASILKQMPLKIFVRAGGMSVREAYDAYKNNALEPGV